MSDEAFGIRDFYGITKYEDEIVSKNHAIFDENLVKDKFELRYPNDGTREELLEFIAKTYGDDKRKKRKKKKELKRFFVK